MFFISLLVLTNGKKPGEGHFLYYLMLENHEVQKIMTHLKSVIKVYFKGDNQDFFGFSPQTQATGWSS